ncbi:unnamed protein product [Closterium sp. NIES-65]|nr:unnamed protein product [Closterium sp. NIES-65]
MPRSLTLGALPEEAKRRIEDPNSKYSFGWSEGKESVEAGRRDALKASFYANPLTDTPTTDPELIRRFPTYCRPNVWPSQDLPELEPAFKALGRLIVDVGKQLLQHCDAYVHSRNPHVPSGKLLRVVEQSPCHKARLLLYLSPQQPPPAPSAAQGEREGEGEGELPAESSRVSREEAVACAGNGGNGGVSASESLTAVADADVSSWCLTRAQFWRGGEAVEGSDLDPSCGLYIRTRDGQIVQARIPEGCIAFQVGHAMSIQSGGLLAATPHCVAAPKGSASSIGVSRATLAVFMQVRTVHADVAAPATALTISKLSPPPFPLCFHYVAQFSFSSLLPCCISTPMPPSLPCTIAARTNHNRRAALARSSALMVRVASMHCAA